MTTTINGKTPDEIKEGLKKCPNADCSLCLSRFHCDLEAEALEYIHRLEVRIDTLTAKAVLFDEAVVAGEKMKRERDAAVKQLKDVDTVDLFYCSHCKHEELCDYNLNSCDDCEKDCPCHTCVDMCNWQWCGV